MEEQYTGLILDLFNSLLTELNISPFTEENSIFCLIDEEEESNITYSHLSPEKEVLPGSNKIPCFKTLDDSASYAEIINCVSESFITFFSKPHFDLMNDFRDKKIKQELFNILQEKIRNKLNNLLFDDIELFIELSNTRYEKSVCKGYIVYEPKNEVSPLLRIGDKDYKIEFSSKNKRLIRKLLEVTSDDLALLVGASENSGIYYLKDFVSFNEETEDFDIIVKFCGYRHFEIYKEGQLFIEYNVDKFKFSAKTQLSKSQLQLVSSFLGDEDKCTRIEKLVNSIKKLGDHFHGALIVITDDDEFVNRMHKNKRSTKVLNCENVNIFNSENDVTKLVTRLSCIDGAIIVNTNGEVLSFGTILDGRSNTPGKQERGSRYNSTLTFVNDYFNTSKENNLNQKYLAIVMSEDGSINVLDGKEDIEV